MSDIRESFPTLENAGTKAGVALTSSQTGDAQSGKVGAVGFSFQDSSGNLILPALDAQGRFPVSTDQQGTRLRAHGDVPGIIPTYVSPGVYTGLQQVLSIPLTVSKTIGDFGGKVASRKGAYFELVYSDGSSSVILDSSIVDAGQYTAQLGMGPSEDTFSVPASATSPVLKIIAGNFETISDLHATLTVLQF